MGLIFPFLPRDNSRQSHAFGEAARTLATRQPSRGRQVTLLDLGCGRGDSREEFTRSGFRVDWRGLEVAGSPEAAAAGEHRGDIVIYDGVHIPFAPATFDMVYSRQAFEHVRLARELVHEVSRVLKCGGIFAGSCSSLEPFHSRSLCNFTPYGFCTLLSESDFREIRVRPGVDSMALIGRRLLRLAGIPVGSRPFVKESALNVLLELASRLLGFPTERRAALKLLFCGHFVFTAMKAD